MPKAPLGARLALGLALGAALALGVGVSALAQASAGNQAPSEPGAGPGGATSASVAPTSQTSTPSSPNAAATAPTTVSAPPPVNAAPAPSNAAEAPAPTNSAPVRPALAPPPPAAPKPVRSGVAILQALDKVTAETIRFSAPVGQPIRYKNLVFVVKACETSDLGQPTPAFAAYLTIDSAPLGAPGVAPPPAKRVFKGWMFAGSPALNPFQHPVYDAWLISCAAATPPA